MSVKLYMVRHSKDFVWRKEDEEFHPDCISYSKRSSETGMIFWRAFRKGSMGPGVFFRPEPGKNVDSTVSRDQILLGPLKRSLGTEFWRCYNPIFMDQSVKRYVFQCDNSLRMICH